MSITRTAMTDDDGSLTTGTIINNAWKTALYNEIDGRWSEATITSTGNQDDLDYSEADVLRCNNATDLTIRGLLAPASPAKPGKRLIIVSVGAGNVYLAHQNTNSTAANRIITFATSGNGTPLAAGSGVATLEYDDTTDRWRLISHEQGAWIAVTYNSGDFSTVGSTWGVDSGDVKRHAYRLSGRTLTEYIEITGSDVGATPGAYLKSVIPNSFTAAGRATCQNMYKDAGGSYAMGASWIAAAAQAYIGHYKSDFATAWTATTSDNTELYLTMTYEVQ